MLNDLMNGEKVWVTILVASIFFVGVQFAIFALVKRDRGAESTAQKVNNKRQAIIWMIATTLIFAGLCTLGYFVLLERNARQQSKHIRSIILKHKFYSSHTFRADSSSARFTGNLS